MKFCSLFQLKKNNEDLTPADAKNLETVNKGISILTKNVEKVKNDQKHHQHVIHEFCLKHPVSVQ